MHGFYIKIKNLGGFLPDVRFNGQSLATALAAKTRPWILGATASFLLALPTWAQTPIAHSMTQPNSAAIPRPSTDITPDVSQQTISGGLLPEMSSRGRGGFRAQVGQSFRDCSVCPEMVVIPPGRFVMGSLPSERGRDDDEGPQRSMMMREPLAVGKFEVTNAEWNACVAARACSPHIADRNPVRLDYPVVDVSWNDAQAYVRWLGLRTGKSYRLLTEAEWEYAARAGTKTAYPWGDSISPLQANYSESSLGAPRPVGSYPPNPWGLHDMHGNVYEWVQDCYVHGYNTQSTGRTSDWVARNRRITRVIRGGSWRFEGQALRSSARSDIPQWHNVSDIGLRVARTR